MNIKIYGKNIDVTEGIKTKIYNEFDKLSKYIENKYGETISNDTELDIVMEVKKRRHKVEATLKIDGNIIRAEEDVEDMYASIASCAKKIEGQLKKFNKMLISKKQKARNVFAKIVEEIKEEINEELLGENEDEIVNAEIKKRKNLDLVPITEEEAVEQMFLTNHDFYIFKNVETNTIDIVYKRNDNTVGILSVNN